MQSNRGPILYEGLLLSYGFVRVHRYSIASHCFPLVGLKRTASFESRNGTKRNDSHLFRPLIFRANQSKTHTVLLSRADDDDWVSAGEMIDPSAYHAYIRACIIFFVCVCVCACVLLDTKKILDPQSRSLTTSRIKRRFERKGSKLSLSIVS